MDGQMVLRVQLQSGMEAVYIDLRSYPCNTWGKQGNDNNSKRLEGQTARNTCLSSNLLKEEHFPVTRMC